MNKYPLGRDILVRWSLDLGGQQFDGIPILEYSTAGGAKIASFQTYTIEDDTLIWLFEKESQHAYGVYGLKLSGTISGEPVVYKERQAFEIIHGPVSESEQTVEMESTVETSQEPIEEPVEEEESSEYVSRSPLHVEKVPLGSNIVVQWKLLSSDDFDFDLEECDLRLMYAAAGS